MSKNLSLHGTLSLPGDKSITHRALLFSAITDGTTTIDTFSLGRDNLACARVLGQLGVRVEGTLTPGMLALAEEEGLKQFRPSSDDYCHLQVQGVGFDGLRSPKGELDCGNSGTLGRLLTGYLAGGPIEATLVGDASLSKRPFKRVTEPLSEMGARFSSDMLPLRVYGAPLKGIDYFNAKASAQVKSAILLAGLRASGKTRVVEPYRSRDHSERMLLAMGAELKEQKTPDGQWEVTLEAGGPLRALEHCVVPGDFSAAAFFLVAGTIFKGSELRLQGVGVNPTRIGLLHLLKRMGASIELQNARKEGGELIADIIVRAAPLEGIDVGPEELVLSIDEIPILCVAAAVAKGSTRVRGGEELRVKETDRIALMVQLLDSFGVEVEEFPDGMEIRGSSLDALRAAPENAAWRRSGDHRIAMSGAILELLLQGAYLLEDEPAVETSFPNFRGTLDACYR